jgi:hypothetical protein
LLIIVFAPEDVQDIERPYPLPPEKRILYVSTVPRTDAGAAEAFVIRLLQAQLDQFHISVGMSARQSGTDSSRLAQSTESALAFRDNVRERLRPRLQEEQNRADRFVKTGRDKVKALSAIPLHLRDNKLQNNRFLIKDKKDLQHLKEVQDQVFSEGLKRLAKHKSTLRLTLTKADLVDLGLREEEGKVSGKVDSLKLAAKVRSLMKGVDLVRVRTVKNPSPDELERKYLAIGATDRERSGAA